MDPLDSEHGDLYEALDRLKKQRYLEPDPKKRRLRLEAVARRRKAESETLPHTNGKSDREGLLVAGTITRARTGSRASA